MTRPKTAKFLSLVMREFFVLTIHAEFVRAYGKLGALRAAEQKQVARLVPMPLRDFAVDKHGSVDDHPYGGGDGMVLRPEPLAAALASLPCRPKVILTSPSGKVWTQRDAEQYAASPEPLAFICGRFAGVDQRFTDRYVDAVYSCGDVVLTGGELPALMMIDSIVRLMPEVLGNSASARQDSFADAFDGGLEHSLYTRPPVFEGLPVPEVLLSGDHAAIAAWRAEDALSRTRRLRPDLCRD